MDAESLNNLYLRHVLQAVWCIVDFVLVFQNITMAQPTVATAATTTGRSGSGTQVRSLQEMLKDAADMTETSSSVHSGSSGPVTTRAHPTTLPLSSPTGMFYFKLLGQKGAEMVACNW